MKRWLGLSSAWILVQLSVSACAVVPQNHRARLADPAMKAADDPTDLHRKRKLYTSREAAAGGDGKTAGGGCACQ